MSALTAEAVFGEFWKLSTDERARFYALLAEGGGGKRDLTHEEVFGHLDSADFTSAEAADYLEVSMATFRRYVSAGRIAPSSQMGRNQLFSTQSLRALKRALRGG